MGSIPMPLSKKKILEKINVLNFDSDIKQNIYDTYR